MDDLAQTIPNTPVQINVLINDSDPDGTLDPGTVTLTRAPTNGTATADPYTGAITYTPNPGFAGTNTFRYTVQDDLGASSPEATVTVVVAAPAAPAVLTSPTYFVSQVLPSANHQCFPRINNLGEVVWQERVGGLWQVVTPGRGAVTIPDSTYSDGVSPAIDDDGRILCARTRTNSTQAFTDLLLYPNAVVAETNPAPEVLGRSWRFENEYRIESVLCVPEPSFTSSGVTVTSIVASYYLKMSGDSGSYSRLFIGSREVAGGESGWWNRPDANEAGDFVYISNRLACLNNAPRFAADAASISDAPLERPDIVYAYNTNLYSSILGRLDSGNPGELTGSWVDVNRSGVLVFEKVVSGHTNVFKAWPLEPRILSVGATNALVGFPYQFDVDNIVEAYGGEPEDGDPRGAGTLQWYAENAPPGFTIDPVSARVEWTPQAAGIYTFVIVARTEWENVDPAEHRLPVTVHVRQSTFETPVDAVDYRIGSSPDLVTNPNQYFAGGQPRIGVVADGASRLVLRVKLEDVNTNSARALHFVIGGTNAGTGRDGHLLALGSTSWALDVTAMIVKIGGTNKAICVYESPLDYDAASQPVTIELRHHDTVIATNTIPLARPPVVLVHGGWSGPAEWNVMFDKLIDLGVNVYFFDYGLLSGTAPASLADLLFLKTGEAVQASRNSGFAASQVDLVGHGAGAILARLHAQRYAIQGPNYYKGDVHKLISIGGPHGGSYLADCLLGLKSTNAVAYTNLRSAVLSASEAAGYFPPVDLNQGLMASLATGSTMLTELQEAMVPCHAIVTTADLGLAPDI